MEAMGTVLCSQYRAMEEPGSHRIYSASMRRSALAVAGASRSAEDR